MKQLLKGIISILIPLFILSSCAQVGKPIFALNSDIQHIQNGHMLLEKKNYALAKSEFEKASTINKYSFQPYMGLAVVYLRQNKLNEAYDELKKALKAARTNKEKIKVKSGFIQYYSSHEFIKRHHGKNAWFVMSEETFMDVEKIGKSNEVYYYMARAYCMDFKFDKARKLLKRIQKTQNPFTLLASEELKKIDIVEKLSKKYEKTKGIIFSPVLTKEILSYILIDIFNIQEKIKRKTNVKYTSKDTINSEYLESISQIINLNIKGLLPYEDRTFRPNKRVTRADLAVVLYDIYKKGTGKKFAGKSEVTYSDIDKGNWFADSVAFVTNYRIMNEEDSLTMEFRPFDNLTVLNTLNILDYFFTDIVIL
ncbi:MAG: tetratricopeptide repeat protein [Nitrospinae bacterium]|nr:tetratricopeptide repeat protein [Nitrospinota bacterium]